MNPRTLSEITIARECLQRGEAVPALVWETVPDGRGGRTRRKVSPDAYARRRRGEWQATLAGTREKLGLSPAGFASLLGVSLRTLKDWERGVRQPGGPARVLLRIAGEHPEIVRAAA
ncbi:MAG: helix-turn-helix domain-containing protein [Limisphaerales bacterium]